MISILENTLQNNLRRKYLGGVAKITGWTQNRFFSHLTQLRRYQFIRYDSSWQLDETYVKVKGKWHYFYRAINKQGEKLDFYFSHKRNKEAAYQFLRRCLRCYDLDNQPKTLNTDKHSSYAHAIARLKKEGRLQANVEQRQVKYLNNGIESDHSPIKKLVVAGGGFKLRKRA